MYHWTHARGTLLRCCPTPGRGAEDQPPTGLKLDCVICLTSGRSMKICQNVASPLILKTALHWARPPTQHSEDARIDVLRKVTCYILCGTYKQDHNATLSPAEWGKRIGTSDLLHMQRTCLTWPPALWVVRKKSQTMPSQQQTLPDGAGAVSKIVLVSRLKPPIPQYLVWWGRDVTGCMVGRWGWEGPPCFRLWHGCFALLVSAICERLESVFLSLSGGPVTLPINLDTCPLSIITGTSEFCPPPVSFWFSNQAPSHNSGCQGSLLLHVRALVCFLVYGDRRIPRAQVKPLLSHLTFHSLLALTPLAFPVTALVLRGS